MNALGGRFGRSALAPSSNSPDGGPIVRSSFAVGQTATSLDEIRGGSGSAASPGAAADLVVCILWNFSNSLQIASEILAWLSAGNGGSPNEKPS
mmetsp:Transcript_7543/g.22255  ORF Transcript_7543/g.22255 Transcript_7543/m.22255 type:complete len:94 (-) Transcript_7543:217-498(-)